MTTNPTSPAQARRVVLATLHTPAWKGGDDMTTAPSCAVIDLHTALTTEYLGDR